MTTLQKSLYAIPYKVRIVAVKMYGVMVVIKKVGELAYSVKPP